MAAHFTRWRKAEAIFSLRHVVTRTAVHLLLPTCLVELLVIWLLVPLWGVLVFPVFLVLPVLNLTVLRLTGGISKRWKSCEACFQRGNLVLRLPGKDMLVIKDRSVTHRDDGRLEIAWAGGKIWIEPDSSS